MSYHSDLVLGYSNILSKTKKKGEVIRNLYAVQFYKWNLKHSGKRTDYTTLSFYLLKIQSGK